MRKAVIDLGTNTFHLLIADLGEGQVQPVCRLQIPVKLGEGGIQEGVIAPPAFERGLRALEIFRGKLDEYACDEYRCVATSGIRSAANGLEFIEEASRCCRIRIELIDGLMEAEYIFKGVIKAVPEGVKPPFLIMDIGGGSVEFILCENEQQRVLESYDIGAARLISGFHRMEPIGTGELALLRNYLSETLSGLMARVRHAGVKSLIGSAGSFESVVDLIEGTGSVKCRRLSDSFIEIVPDEFRRVYELLLRSDREQREQLPGMADFRVEMMVVASVLIDTVFAMSGAEKLYCSLYSLKEGLMGEEAGDQA